MSPTLFLGVVLGPDSSDTFSKGSVSYHSNCRLERWLLAWAGKLYHYLEEKCCFISENFSSSYNGGLFKHKYATEAIRLLKMSESSAKMCCNSFDKKTFGQGSDIGLEKSLGARKIPWLHL